MSNLRYRPEIDGLRALAVIGVVLYHIGLGFPGGYVGVDVFFVISGYLITGIIAKDLRNGTFSMLDFWVRRIRRILPAVTVTVVASLILGYFILEAEQFKALAESSIAQSLMAANVFFWLDNMSYFAEASDMKPLLHTWSLAVEEQFYVVFPLFLSLLSKHLRKYTLPVIISVCVVSLVLSCWAQMHKPGANFFLLPTRAWELMLGAVIALMNSKMEMPRKVAEAGAWLGLAMIVAAMSFYDAETPFPGWTAILPVAGSGIFIWSNNTGQTSAGKLLSLRPLVFIGLISYSLYLWHWPILVFIKHVIIDISLPWKLGILMISLILSILSWKWVETPFRRKGFLSKRSSAFGFAALSTIGLLLMSATIWKMNGLPDRYDDFVVLREDISWVGKEYESELGSYVEIGAESSANERMEVKPSFALWGDSHAMCISATVDKVARSHGLNGHVYAGPGRIPVIGVRKDDLGGVGRLPDHVRYNDEVMQSIIDNRIKNVILVGMWAAYVAEKSDIENEYQTSSKMRHDNLSEISVPLSPHFFARRMETMAEKLKLSGVKVWFIKQWPYSNNFHAAQEFYMGKRFSFFNKMPSQYAAPKKWDKKKQASINEAIDSLPSYLLEALNSPSYFYNNSSRLKIYDDRAYYRDAHHLTRAGSDYYLTEMLDGIFAEIAEQQKNGP